MYLHKSSHHLMIWIHEFEEVQYFVNLLDLTSTFTTKELPRRCFAKAKVMRNTVSSNLHSSYLSEQSRWLLLCVSLTYLHKKKTAAQQTIACSRSTVQELDKLYNVYKVYNKDTRARSIDNILVSLLLTVNIFHTLF